METSFTQKDLEQLLEDLTFKSINNGTNYSEKQLEEGLWEITFGKHSLLCGKGFKEQLDNEIKNRVS